MSTGTVGVQICKALGAYVVGVCSTTNVQLVKDLGADEVVDYKTTDVTQKYRNQDLDIVFDTIGEAAEVRARFLGHLNRIIWTIVGFFFGYQQFDSSKSPH